MKFDDVNVVVAHLPTIQPKQGRILYDFILREKPEHCLELGFAHGKSSCYIAAALDELGCGHLTTVDLFGGPQNPSIEETLAQTGLQSYVTPVREKVSYTYFLKSTITEQSTSGICVPMFDFCFIDGPKHWVTDGLAFFLVDKLLRDKGWILFDDYSWTYADQVQRKQIDNPDDYYKSQMVDHPETPHIQNVVNLLVMQHPNYSNFQVLDADWAFAQKIKGDAKHITYSTSDTFLSLIKKTLKRVAGLT